MTVTVIAPDGAQMDIKHVTVIGTTGEHKLYCYHRTPETPTVVPAGEWVGFECRKGPLDV